MYGLRGAGIGEREGLLHEMDIISSTLGKSFGAHGGYVTGSKYLIDTIRSFGSGFIFTTALPPSIIAAGLKSLEILQGYEGVQLRKKHKRVVQKVKEKLMEAKIPLINSPSQVVPVLVSNEKLILEKELNLIAYNLRKYCSRLRHMSLKIEVPYAYNIWYLKI